jgi:hypothetical protein
MRLVCYCRTISNIQEPLYAYPRSEGVRSILIIAHMFVLQTEIHPLLKTKLRHVFELGDFFRDYVKIRGTIFRSHTVTLIHGSSLHYI